LPLDNLYDLLKPLIPVLTRSNLPRCLQRNGVSRLFDLATRYAYVKLHDNKRMDTAAAFLDQALIQYPFKIEKILTEQRFIDRQARMTKHGFLEVPYCEYLFSP
jgi:hypothetical protein